MAEAQEFQNPDTQFQMGDRVLYKPDGIIATVTGYQWVETMGHRPKLIGYELSCGITVGFESIAKWPTNQP